MGERQKRAFGIIVEPGKKGVKSWQEVKRRLNEEREEKAEPPLTAAEEAWIFFKLYAPPMPRTRYEGGQPMNWPARNTEILTQGLGLDHMRAEAGRNPNEDHAVVTSTRSSPSTTRSART